MSNETKRDVFDAVVNSRWRFLDGNTKGEPTDDECMMAYEAALPDDLPVIPEAVGEILQSAQGKTNLLGMLDTARNGHKVSEPLAWIIANQNTFVLAWVLGVWSVKETGEIVKLEAEK